PDTVRNHLGFLTVISDVKTPWKAVSDERLNRGGPSYSRIESGGWSRQGGPVVKSKETNERLWIRLSSPPTAPAARLNSQISRAKRGRSFTRSSGRWLSRSSGTAFRVGITSSVPAIWQNRLLPLSGWELQKYAVRIPV
ncbi:unnamed protein product, partial [Nesidiocoris tenuis]